MIRLLVNFLEFVLNTLYRDRLYPRFYVLETVARVPYFAYLSVLHLYETFGWWRKSDWLQIHFAESWNELHHLLTMESLGGNKHWIDPEGKVRQNWTTFSSPGFGIANFSLLAGKTSLFIVNKLGFVLNKWLVLPRLSNFVQFHWSRFIAHSGAFVYYWILVFVYMLAPRSAYYFTQLVEEHAYHTYDQFLQTHEAELKTQPAPQVAINYYRDGDLYLFDEFQTSHPLAERRPQIENLYDVFVAIRDDEGEHVKTMVTCQQFDAQKSFKSPHSPAATLPEGTAKAIQENAELILETSNQEPVGMS